MEYESVAGSLTYRYTYGLQKINAVVYGINNGAGSVMESYVYPNGSANVVKLWYHHDRLGSTDFLTDYVQGHVTSYVTYDDWGAPTMKAIVRLGARELDLVTEYTGHLYDPILGVYYARARMYDASDRRFMAVDGVKGIIAQPATLVQYTYVLDNPLIYIDQTGLILSIVYAIDWNSEGIAQYRYATYKELNALKYDLQALTSDRLYIDLRLTNNSITPITTGLSNHIV